MTLALIAIILFTLVPFALGYALSRRFNSDALPSHEETACAFAMSVMLPWILFGLWLVQ